MTVRTRFAPSPTGFLHIGGARTALFCWLYARHYQGEFILRIEDTDRTRSTEASVQSILNALSWLGFDYDAGPFFQSQRLERYREAAQQLLSAGHAYHCYCSREEIAALRETQLKNKQKPRYDGRCRERKQPVAGIDPVLRFKNPTAGAVTVKDMVHGNVTISNAELDDLILLRSDRTPTYNLTVVVDDMDMEITHVLRGEDHLNNTPRQVNLLSALDAPIPKYAHLPMILDTQGKRLSKRTGAASIEEYRDAGYLPAAVLNYLVRLGWSHQSQEIFSTTEMIELFDGENIGISAASLNPEKLNWLNQSYMQTADENLTVPVFTEYLDRQGYAHAAGPDPRAVFLVLRDRYKNLSEMARGAAFLYQDIEQYDAKLVAKYLKPETKSMLIYLQEQIKQLDEWEEAAIKELIDKVCRTMDIKMKTLGPPFRFILTAGVPSPELAVTVALIGKEACLRRLEKAIALISALQE